MEYKSQQDEIPLISETNHDIETTPSLMNTIVWRENLFGKSLASSLPNKDELKKMVTQPGQFLLDEAKFNLKIVQTLLSNPESRRALATNIIDEVKNSFNSGDTMASSTGFLFGAIITPGGSRKFLERLSIPDFKGEKYVQEMINRIPDDAPVLSIMKKDDIADKLRHVRPTDSGNSFVDWMVDHTPPTITSTSPFVARAYLERDLGLLSDAEFSQPALASFAIKWSFRGGVAGGAYQAFSEDTSPKQPATSTPEELNKLQSECTNLLRMANNYNALLQHLHDEKGMLTTEDKKILECISLKLIDEFEKPPTTDNTTPAQLLETSWQISE